MKKTILGLVSVLIITFVQAQKRDHKEQNKQHQKHERKEKLTKAKKYAAKKLNLTDDQKKKMKELKNDFNSKRKALQENEKITVKEQRDKMFELNKQQRNAVQNIFTPEQKKQIADIREKGKGRMAKMQNKKMERMKTKISLTDEQASKIKSARENMMKDMKSLKDNQTISRTDLQKRMKELKDNHKKEMESIFTKEQKNKIEEMKKKNMHKNQEAK